MELFGDPQMSRTLVFTRTKRGADQVARHLEAAGYPRRRDPRQQEPVAARARAARAFRAARIRVLVATDIAARGIDVDPVTHVVNHELPDVPESYVHRIGRTARAGAQGSSRSRFATARSALAARHRASDPAIDPAEDRRSTPTDNERPADSHANRARRAKTMHARGTIAAGLRAQSGPIRDK